MADPGALERSWRELSLKSVWSGEVDWWTPAVEAVVDALSSRHADARPACSALGHERADSGSFLDEARRDLSVVLSVSSIKASAATPLVDALTVGWVDRILDQLRSMPCTDPLTELAPVQYLATRLNEVRAEARLTGRSADDTHVLVVVKTGPVADALRRESHMVLIQSALRSAFRGGETLARVGLTGAVALTVREPTRLRESLAVLGAELSLASDAHRLPPTRTWLEPIPRDAEGLPALLAELAA